MTRPTPPLPRRPVLAPGLAVLQRRDQIQVGRTERHRLQVADTPAVRRTLAVLARGEAQRTDLETRRVLEALRPALRDGDTLGEPGVPAGEVAATSLAHPDSAVERLHARRRTSVSVIGDLGPDTAAVLTGSGLALSEQDAAVTLILSTGPTDRDLTDRLARDGIPYLVLEAIESDITLGPFVVPGRTACLRCLDAHLASDDPLHPALVTAAALVERRDGVAAPVHHAMAVMALGWAAADLVRYAEGDRPASWSATVRFAPDRPTIAPTPWLRHPDCGCSWTGVGAWATHPTPDLGERGPRNREHRSQ